jgi:phenylacetate-CoA ligase
MNSEVHGERAEVSVPRRQSTLPGVAWPLVLHGFAAAAEVLQSQFRETERAAPDVIQALQLRQTEAVAAHAYATSSFWRERLDAAGYGANPDWFARLPVLTRGEVKSADSSIYALPVPPEHGGLHEMKTSGSTGTPMTIVKTDLAVQLWQVMVLRDSLWHQRDLSGKLAVVRLSAAADRSDTWGGAYAGYVTGPCVSFDARNDVDTQLDWLQAEQPDILFTHASNLRALALRGIERGVQLPRLREARVFSEQLAPDLRDRVREAWNVPVTDIYTANEVGYVALQCPQSGRYHVMAEDVLVEIIDDDDRPCGAGESGRVIVTPLHNFAMPLFRYDLGDYATVGGPCGCGRGLPTIERVLGRTRNMLRLPGGRTAFPGFPLDALMRLPAIRELKMIQHTLEDIEIELVLDRTLTGEEEARLIRAIRKRLQGSYRIQLTPVPQITRSSSFKREDFECRMT